MSPDNKSETVVLAPAVHHYGLAFVIMAQKRVEEFLRGKGQVLVVVGLTGSGKLYGTELGAKAVGFQTAVLDRAQGTIDYSRLGACALGQDGLKRVATVVCGADCETATPELKSLPAGVKLIFIGNSCCQFLKKPGIQVVRLNRLTQDAMCKTLFLDHDWPVVKAKRLSALADGDWRRLWNLDRLFAGMDVAEGSEDDFQQLMLDTTKDNHLLDEAPPSAAVHQLFSGYARRSDTVSDYAEHSVLVWAEANKDIVCSSLEQMADLQEAAVYTDMLASGGEHEIGLETFAMAAALDANPELRYDYTKYRNPWVAGKETPESRAIRDSFAKLGPWSRRETTRLSAAQLREDAAPQRAKRRPAAKARATAKKKAPKTAPSTA